MLDFYQFNKDNQKLINWYYIKRSFEKTIEGAGRNKVTIIYDALRFDLLSSDESRFPIMSSDGM